MLVLALFGPAIVILATQGCTPGKGQGYQSYPGYQVYEGYQGYLYV